MSKEQDLRDFHEILGAHIEEKPQIPPPDVQELRKELIKEECKELFDAMDEEDLVGIADGMADLVYVTIGSAVSYGIPFDEVWDEVHRTNMAKQDPTTGKVIYRDDKKILKPKEWIAPDIAGILLRKLRDA